MGVDGVELDVQCSRDGQLVVIHDFFVDKTTSGSGSVANFSAAELAALDAGSHFDPSFRGVGVPTLPEVLDLLQGRCEINLEIKTQAQDGGDEVDLVLALVRERDLYAEVLISSFNPFTLIKTRWLDPHVRIGLLFAQPLPPHLFDAWTSPIIDPQALHPRASLVDAQLVERARKHNLAVNTWTVNSVEEARQLAGLGVTTIMTDVPDEIVAAL